MSDLLLDIKNLQVEAGRLNDRAQRIVNGVDLQLHSGEVLGLIGESGAGKSTIGLAAMGYTRRGMRITGGRVIFKGEDVLALSRRQRARLRGNRIAYIAQSAAAAFNPAKRLFDQICEAPVLHGIMNYDAARAQAVELLGKLRLPDPERFGERYPHQVSGGQLQRAMAAMAMACEPDILIMDEPTTALDVTTQIEVLAAIRELIRERGTAGLYITHDLAVVAQISDRIMVMRHGNMVELGETQQILERPREAYTRQLVSPRKAREKPCEVATERSTLLWVRNVRAAYGTALNVLSDVSLEIYPGETVAVVGESGSGKSTLARVVTGLLPPREGEIRFKGMPLPGDLRERTRAQLREIQMIYQMPDVALNPHHRVFETLARPLSFYLALSGTELSRRVYQLLEEIELGPEHARRFPDELSGGQKQRICIARALAAAPDLIICDEVTSALDQLVAENILQLLQRLQDKTGIAYLFITHDLGLVKVIADRVVVMHRGQVVECGRKTQVFASPRHSYTEMLLASVPEMRVDWLDDVLSSRAGQQLAER